MRKIIAIIAVAIAVPTVALADTVGRYQAFSYVGMTKDGRGFAWVIDTQTGRLKLCVLNEDVFSVQRDFNAPVICGLWSEDVMEYYERTYPTK